MSRSVFKTKITQREKWPTFTVSLTQNLSIYLSVSCCWVLLPYQGILGDSETGQKILSIEDLIPPGGHIWHVGNRFPSLLWQTWEVKAHPNIKILLNLSTKQWVNLVLILRHSAPKQGSCNNSLLFLGRWQDRYLLRVFYPQSGQGDVGFTAHVSTNLHMAAWHLTLDFYIHLTRNLVRISILPSC